MEDRSTRKSEKEFVDKEFYEQFAKDVIDFSSQYAGEYGNQYGSYSAKNLGGGIQIYPKYGDFTQACVLRTYGPWWKTAPSRAPPIPRVPEDFVSEDYIDLAFDTIVVPTGIEIYETYNPGAVTRIIACCSPLPLEDSKKLRWVTLWSGKPKPVPRKSRIFSPSLAVIPYPTCFLRLEFSSALCDYYTELDAVKLIGKRCTDSYLKKWFRLLDDGGQLSLPEEATMMAMMQWLSLGSGSQDPSDGYFSLLPDEVIQKIFSYLDLRTLCKIVPTCKLFQKHAYDPWHFTHVSAQPYWATLDNAGLDSLHSRCEYLKKLSLSWCGNFGQITADCFTRFITGCGRGIVDLRLACCQFVSEWVLETITKCCPNLKELDLHSTKTSGDAIKPLVNCDLTRLNLYRTTVLGPTLVTVIGANPNLQHLNIGNCVRIDSFDTVVTALAQKCPRLKTLDCWRAKTLTDIGVLQLAQGCVHLQELDIGWCNNILAESGSIVKLAKSCHDLRKLFLTANRTVNDDVLAAIAKNCPNLEQLDILGTGQVSVAHIENLLTQCTRLKFFDVSFCSKVDFVHLQGLRDEFPNVQIKKSFQD